MIDTTKLAWQDIPSYLFCQICGQSVKPKGKGSHKRKHPNQNVRYSQLHPEATGLIVKLPGVNNIQPDIGF